MKYFEIKKSDTQIRKAYPGCTQDSTDIECEVIKRFATLVEARNALANYECTYYLRGGTYFVTEYYIEENDYDEDGEFEDCFGIWDFAKAWFNTAEEGEEDD